MFGRGRFHAGILIDPKPSYKFDPSDTVKLAEFRTLIWSVDHSVLYVIVNDGTLMTVQANGGDYECVCSKALEDL